MKNRILLILICSVFSANFLFSQQDFQGISGINANNYPRVDGSTSTYPLNAIIACKLLGVDYEWVQSLGGTWGIYHNLHDIFGNLYVWDVIKSSQTHQSFINLIDKEADLILTARKLSPDEKAYANAAGVSLIETPVALDAFIFIVNPNNPIKSLSVKQIQDIYTGKITNWKEVGGNDAPINPYMRNANSGSQELMESLVMKDLDFREFPEAPDIIHSMEGVIDVIGADMNSICYTVYYYKHQILRETLTKTIAVEGIFPDAESISNNSYPLAAEVYTVIRSDLDKSSMAYKLYEWLQSKSGQDVIAESGYIPYNNHENSIIINHKENELSVYPNPVREGFYIQGIKQATQMNLFDYSGRKVFSKMITDNDYVDISHLQKGFYIINVSTREGNKQFKILKE